jgi:multidrug efflux pump
MVVRTMWPGASAEEVERQLTDSIERKLQETPRLDFLRSYSKPGESVVFVFVKDSSRPTRSATPGTRCGRRWATSAARCPRA